MKFTIKIILLVLLCCYFISNSHGQTKPESLPPEILVSNHELLKKLVSLLSDTSLLNDKDKFINECAGYPVKQRDLGLGNGIAHFRMAVSFSILVSVVTYDNKVVQYVIDYSDDRNNVFDYIIAKDSLLKNKIAKLGEIKKKKSFSYRNNAIYKQMKEHVASQIGAITVDPELQTNASPEFLANYRLLLNPIHIYRFGYSCGIMGNEPEGRKAIDYLSGHNEYAAIRSLIRGYNAEGRIYTIQALLVAVSEGETTLTQEDKVLINKVLNLNVLIETCDGCFGKSVKGVNAIEPALLAIVL